MSLISQKRPLNPPTNQKLTSGCQCKKEVSCWNSTLLGNKDAGVGGQAKTVPKVITPGTVDSFSTIDKDSPWLWQAKHLHIFEELFRSAKCHLAQIESLK